MGAAEDLNLAGKDWLTEIEAAHYCGVSVRQFQAHNAELGLEPRRFMGRKLYLKSDLYSIIEKSDPWHSRHLNGEVASPTYRGPKAANDGAGASARLQPVPLRKFVPRKKPN